MRYWMGLVLACASVLLLADAELPAQQPSKASPPAPSEPTVTLSPAEQQYMQQLVIEAANTFRQMVNTPPQQIVHDALDQTLTGNGLPPAAQKTFIEIFEPQRQTLHQFVDDETKRLQQDIDGHIRSSVPPSKLGRAMPQTSSRARTAEILTSGEWQRRRVAYINSQTSQPMIGEYIWLTQSGSGASATVTESDGIVRAQGSADEKGMKVGFGMEEWIDTAKWVAENGVGMDLSVNKTVGEAFGEFSMNMHDHAHVERCPSADGVVPGKGKVVFVSSGSGGTTSSSVSGGGEFREDFIAEGRVGDDAVVREVKVQVDILVVRRGVIKFNDGTQFNGPLIVRYGGTTTFDPHGSDDMSPVQVTRCVWNKGLVPIDLCRHALKGSLPAVVITLRKAYLKAENKWNFKDGKKENSKCVTAKFIPKTKTVRAKPNQSVPVKVELVAVNGQQPTWGTFDELAPVKSGSIQQNGTKTAPGAPAQLTYTAPPQPWSPSDPPGFDVVKATSRAGTFMREHASEEEYQWLLKPGLKLTIHDKWESHTPFGFLFSEATFPIELMTNARGDLFGQAVVPRTHRQVESPMGINCQDAGHWTEVWQAYALYDETGENLTIKLRFQSSPKQGVAVCPPAPPKAYTDPGVSSDQVRTPLDQFKMPAQDGATKQFVFNFGGVTKTVIDVTLVAADSGGR